MSTIIFNKKIVSSKVPCISHNDRGLTLGHGLFETILVNKNSYPALDYHWRRLETSAPILGITLPFSRSELETMLSELIIDNNLQDKLAGARITVTHGESARGILPVQTPTPNFLITVFECAPSTDRAFSALIVTTRKNEQSAASKVKSMSYLDNILAKQEAMSQGYDEAILLNSVSNIADGSISNVYMVKNGQIFTPLVCDGALPGVIRSILIEEFQQEFPIMEQSLSVTTLLDADEVFLTNALLGIQPLGQLNDKKLLSFSTANAIKTLLREHKNYI